MTPAPRALALVAAAVLGLLALLALAVMLGIEWADTRRAARAIDTARAAERLAAQSREELIAHCRRAIGAALSLRPASIPQPKLAWGRDGLVACVAVDRYADYGLPNQVDLARISCHAPPAVPAFRVHASEAAWRAVCPPAE